MPSISLFPSKAMDLISIEMISSLILLLLYSMNSLLLFGFAFHTCILLQLYRKGTKNKLRMGKAKPPPFPPLDLKSIKASKLPFVSIQLPIYNEFYVVERLLKSVSEILWHRERLEIQVLDDSTDETKEKLQSLVRNFRKKGLPFIYIYRKERTGYKAGALKAGLAKARGEFIAIFDADFCPPPDFLLRGIAYFQEEKLGMLQSRWGHLNAKHSLLTQAQAIGIDGHFIVEQGGRNARKFWINFNGSGGIWRRRCILEAGNWQADTLTEDLDLSYRAELAGWNFGYAPDLVCPAEIPMSVAAFKGQQFRWCKGSIQTALKLSKRIWRSEHNWKIKLEAIVRLLRYCVHPLMLCNIILLPFLLSFANSHIHYFFQFPTEVFFTLVALLCATSLVPSFFYAYAQAQLHSNWPRKALYFPALMLLGAGISLSNTIAWAEALAKKKPIFLRTPKFGMIEKTKTAKQEGPNYKKSSLSPLIFLEIAMGFYCLYSSYFSFSLGYIALSSLISIYACGFFYISLRALWETW